MKDCEFQTFRCSGSGGQKVNKTASGVRIIHKLSGAVGQATDERSQYQNKKLAFERMAKSDKFQKWLRIEASKRMGEKSIDEIVDEQMQEKNLKIEIKDGNNKWIEKGKEC